jgi:hypothetical protein
MEMEMIESAWPPRDVILKLVEAAEHLLRVHDCDCKGYEETVAAVEVAKRWLAASGPPSKTAGHGEPSGSMARTDWRCDECGKEIEQGASTTCDECWMAGRPKVFRMADGRPAINISPEEMQKGLKRAASGPPSKTADPGGFSAAGGGESGPSTGSPEGADAGQS